jgi:hypothetical protein
MTTTTIRSLTASAKLGWGKSQMMKGRATVGCIPILAAMFTAGFLPGASADVVNMDNFNVTLINSPIFNDTFSANQVLAGGGLPGTVLPSGINFPDGSSANYQVTGTVTQIGGKAVLDTAQGAQLVQPAPFFQVINANIVNLLTGPPTGPGSTAFSLTANQAFTTIAQFDLNVPPTPGGFYQVDFSDRVASNHSGGDVLSMTVRNCIPQPGTPCAGVTGPYIVMSDANFTANTNTALGVNPLDTSNQQILLELTKPDASSDTVDGYYEYFNNGMGGGLVPLGSFDDLFTGPGDPGYTQAGFTQLAPVPEPSTLTLLGCCLLGLVAMRARNSRPR